MQFHCLKTASGYYHAVADGSKTFELRRDDRAYAVGDELWLREWTDEEGYSGSIEIRVVTFVLRNGDPCIGDAIAPGWVIMGLGQPPF